MQEWYDDMPLAAYLGREGISSSGLKRLEASPAHFMTKQKPTDALDVGAAFHSFGLQPDIFDTEFAVAPKLDRRTKAGKSAYDQFQKDNAGRIIIADDDFGLIQTMWEAIRANQTANELLSLSGLSEISLFWRDFGYGIPCKARIDRIVTDKKSVHRGTLIDLKTITPKDGKSAGLNGFAREIAARKYHWQAAWNLDAANIVLGSVGNGKRFFFRRFVFVAVEKTPPYGVGVYELTPDILDTAARQMEPLKRVYADCLRTGNWHGYPDELQTIDRLPGWAMQVESTEEEGEFVYD